MTFPCLYIVHFDIYFFLPFLVPFPLITFPSQLVLFLILFLLSPPLNSSPFSLGCPMSFIRLA